ncbi:MAG: hypothetical protein ACLFWL_12875 [Candidatus Brocadiia bacterium]
MRWFKAQFRALGTTNLPGSLELDGHRYELEQEFKHSFAAAVGLYRCGDDRIVVKFHRQKSFFGLPLGELGKLMAWYEATIMTRCDDLKGVPRLRGQPVPGSVAHDFVPGHPLHRDSKVDDRFFPRFLDLLESLHDRGIAYVDLEKARNVLVGEDGRPYLIDFQVAYWIPDRLLGNTTVARFIRNLLQEADRYHAMKHFRRVRPDLLSGEEIAHARDKPRVVRFGNFLSQPYKKIKRFLLGKSQKSGEED